MNSHSSLADTDAARSPGSAPIGSRPRPTAADRLRAALAIVVGRGTSVILRGLLRRGASAGPGIMANAIAPRMLRHALAGFPDGLVLVSGSSGKSTTTKMLVSLLRAHGLEVFTNDSTANLRQGIMSAVLERCSWDGSVVADIAVIEIDEAAATQLRDQLDPRVTVLTNVSSDQLDRFHSVGAVAEHLRGLAGRSGRLVLNRDDGFVRQIGEDAEVPVSWYGATGAARAEWHGEMGYARATELDDRPWLEGAAGTRLESASTPSHTVLRREALVLDLPMPARGIHYAVDAAAAVEAAALLLGPGFAPDLAHDAFAGLTPVFGRGEVVEVDGEEIEFVLVQNLASFRLNLRALDPLPPQIMVAIGSDVRDPSWLWDVPLEILERIDVVSGSRAYELASRLDYDDIQVDVVEPDLLSALDRLRSLPRPAAGRKTVVYSADAMRRVRRALALAA